MTTAAAMPVQFRLAHDPLLTEAWAPVKLSPRQLAFVRSRKRFNYAYCGRRSFKTEGACRRLVRSALSFHRYSDGRFFACAPTHKQAEDIFWDRVKALVPAWAVAGGPDRGISEGDLTIDLINGARIKVAGLDKPQRVEGGNWDGGIIDEYADCRPDILEPHIMPMTMRGGWIDIIGVPDGRNHFYREIRNAEADVAKVGELSEYAVHHWKTVDVLHLWLGRERAAAEIAARRATMDPLTFAQEYEASFVTFSGRVYYGFDRDVHASQRIPYNPNRPICLCFDFNVEPGVCAYVQETRWRGDDQLVAEDGRKFEVAPEVTAVIGEVHIPRNSNTPTVCRRILHDFGPEGRFRNHGGEVHLYGDPAGGQRSTKSEAGSDWEIIRTYLGPKFGNRLIDMVARCAPPERPSVNAVNSRLTAADGTVAMLVDPVHCPRTIDDLESVVVKEGTVGEIDKSDEEHTHLTDAIRYYMHEVHPIEEANYSQSGEII